MKKNHSKNYSLSIYKIKIYLSISSFSFLIIAEMQFIKILSIKPQQKNIKSINKRWFVNARAVPNNIKINVK